MNKVKENKELVKNILDRYVKREGIKSLMDMLDRTDFYTAPASKFYHSNYEGGLVQHSLYVYQALLDHLVNHADLEGLVEVVNLAKGGEILLEDQIELLNNATKIFFGDKVTFESVVICTILHDLHKLNYYEKYTKSVFKGYDDWGKKIFEDEDNYKVREDAFVFGCDGSNSNYLIRAHIKMSYEEQLAVENHMGYIDGHPQSSASKAWAKSPLSLYLHLADMEATYYYERR